MWNLLQIDQSSELTSSAQRPFSSEGGDASTFLSASCTPPPMMDPSTDAHGIVRSSVQGGACSPVERWVMPTCGVPGVQIEKFQDLFHPSGIIPAHITLAGTCLLLVSSGLPPPSSARLGVTLLGWWLQTCSASGISSPGPHQRLRSFSPLSSGCLLTVCR